MKKMIKILSLLCVFSLVFAATGCKDNTTIESSYSTYEIYDDVTSDGNSSEDNSIINDNSNSENLIKPNNNNSSKTSNNKENSSVTIDYEKAYSADLKIDSPQEKVFSSLRGTTLTCQVFSSVISDSIQQQFNFMKKKYGVVVKPIVMTDTEMQQKLPAMVSAGTAPDFCLSSETNTMKYACGNIMTALDKYIVADDSVWKNNGVSRLAKYKNNVYAVEDYSDATYYVYYNKTLFKELKIKDPYEYYKESNWNFDTFRKVAKAATIKQGNTTKTYGVMTWNYNVFLMANGSTVVHENKDGTWSTDLGSKASINALNFIRDITADGSFKSSGGYTEFASRGCSMIIERPWNAIGNYDYYNRMKDEIGMVPMPKGPDVSKYQAPQGPTFAFVPRNAKNVKAGLMYIYERRIAMRAANETSTDPDAIAVRNRTMSAEHRAIRDEYLKNAVPIFSNLEALSGWNGVEGVRRTFWNKIYEDQSDATQVVDSMKGLITDCLKKTVGSAKVK